MITDSLDTFDAITLRGLDWLIHAVAVADVRTLAGDGETAWNGLPFRLVQQDSHPEFDLADVPVKPKPGVPGEGLVWTLQEQRWRLWEHPKASKHVPGLAADGNQNLGLFLSSRQRRLLLRCLAGRIDGFAAPDEGQPGEAETWQGLEDVMNFVVVRHPTTLRKVVELILSVPVEVADHFEKVGMVHFQHELFVLWREYPAILTLVADHPKVMMVIASHLREHCTWTPGELAQWVALFRRGLADALAATGLPRTRASVTLLDGMRFDREQLERLRKQVKGRRLQEEAVREIVRRGLGITPFELARLLVLMELPDFGSHGPAAPDDDDLLSEGQGRRPRAHELMAGLAVSKGWRKFLVRVWTRKATSPKPQGSERASVRPAAGDTGPWHPSIPVSIAGWTRPTSMTEYRAVRERFQNCLLNYRQAARDGRLLVFVREACPEFAEPVLVVMSGPGGRFPGRALAAGLVDDRPVTGREACRIVLLCRSLWLAAVGRPLARCEEWTLIRSLMPHRYGFEWNFASPSPEELQRELQERGIDAPAPWQAAA